MKWVDLFALAEGSVVEDISNSTDDFFNYYSSKLFAAAFQTKVARTLLCLESTYEFTTVDGTEEYALPADFISLDQVRWEDTWFVLEKPMRPMVAPEVESNPFNCYVRSNVLGFYPIPAATGEDIKMWYKRLAAPYALRLKDIGTTHTAVTLTVNDSSEMEFVVTGGAAAATYTIDLTATASNTITGLVTTINAESGLKTIIKAEKCETQIGTTDATELEKFDAVSIYGLNRCYFIEPEIPEEMQIDILFNALMYHLKLTDRERDVAIDYLNDANDALKNYKILWRERRKGSGNLIIGDQSAEMMGVPLGMGGAIIVT